MLLNVGLIRRNIDIRLRIDERVLQSDNTQDFEDTEAFENSLDKFEASR